MIRKLVLIPVLAGTLLSGVMTAPAYELPQLGDGNDLVY